MPSIYALYNTYKNILTFPVDFRQKVRITIRSAFIVQISAIAASLFLLLFSLRENSATIVYIVRNYYCTLHSLYIYCTVDDTSPFAYNIYHNISLTKEIMWNYFTSK